ncbi:MULTISPECIES: CAP domain-containing protein [unclassified Variovorax]|uniref:CAP domain-containing protein n=1 Tax=unclassified Variovorax TaxID=663243 RepID=UPI0011AFB2BE|nr:MULTISPECIES: CAP domain-containing protein [unclassified Variovorax]
MLALAALTLVACGGGGGGGGGSFALPVAGTGTAPSSDAAAPVAPAAPAAPTDTAGGGTGNTGNTGGNGGNTGVVPTLPSSGDSTLVTSINAATYADSSEELAAFTRLNAERLKCGFGLLQQNQQLDVAAAGHANYLLRNNMAGHFQNPADSFFTGNNALDRALAAGYSPKLVLDDNSDVTGTGANLITGRGIESVRSLLSAPYHALSLLSSELDIGISIMSSDTTGTTGTHGPRSISQFNLALAQGAFSQKPNSAAVQTYPCDGTVGTAHTLRNESPNPIPGRDLNVNPIGQPIIVVVRPGQGIAISSATMKEKASGAIVTLRPVMTKANDANGMLNPSQAVLMPDAPLTPNTEYEVSIAGTNTTLTFDGTNWNSTGTNPAITDNATGAFNKTFSFTTGS